MATYELISFNGQVTAVRRRLPGGGEISFAIGNQMLGNADYAEYLAWLAAGNVPDPPAPSAKMPAPRAEQVDALVAQSKAALAAATTVVAVKAIIAAILDGLASIDGTGARP